MTERQGDNSVARGTQQDCRRAPHPGSVARRASRPGYLLMEVVIALGLLTLGLATIGIQIQTAYNTSRDTQRLLRAMHLAESKLAELDARLIEDVDSAIEDDLEEEFGRLFPDFAWRLRLEPTQTEELWLVQLDILFQERQDIDEEEFDFDEAEVVYTVRTLRATPATIDPARDFGADEETMERLAAALAGTGLDEHALDLGMLQQIPTDQLLELLAIMQEIGLFDLSDLASQLPPEILDFLNAAGVGDLGTSGGGREG